VLLMTRRRWQCCSSMKFIDWHEIHSVIIHEVGPGGSPGGCCEVLTEGH
jgi:hypothetical protein